MLRIRVSCARRDVLRAAGRAAAGAAPNVVIDVRLMAINVINLNKKQYNNIGAMQINSTKWEINKTNCRLSITFVFVVFVFVHFFGISFGFVVDFKRCLCICCCLLGILV